mgnify:FL=1
MLGCSPYESSLAPIICMVGAILFGSIINVGVTPLRCHPNIYYRATFIIEPEKNTDAVNVSQLKAAKTEVEAGRNVTVEHRLHG